jgi:mutator protein MutT
MSSKPEIRVVAVAFVRKNPATEVLLFRRKAGQSFAGFYEFPGGKVEVGESDEQALAREIKEELSLELGRLEKVGESRFDTGSKWIQLVLFKTNWNEDYEPDLKDHDDFQWLQSQQTALKIAPADLPFLQTLFE